MGHKHNMISLSAGPIVIVRQIVCCLHNSLDPIEKINRSLYVLSSLYPSPLSAALPSLPTLNFLVVRSQSTGSYRYGLRLTVHIREINDGHGTLRQ